jgi:hypothetical protein
MSTGVQPESTRCAVTRNCDPQRTCPQRELPTSRKGSGQIRDVGRGRYSGVYPNGSSTLLDSQ